MFMDITVNEPAGMPIFQKKQNATNKYVDTHGVFTD
jgi:hypothetical protein